MHTVLSTTAEALPIEVSMDDTIGDFKRKACLAAGQALARETQVLEFDYAPTEGLDDSSPVAKLGLSSSDGCPTSSLRFAGSLVGAGVDGTRPFGRNRPSEPLGRKYHVAARGVHGARRHGPAGVVHQQQVRVLEKMLPVLRRVRDPAAADAPPPLSGEPSLDALELDKVKETQNEAYATHGRSLRCVRLHVWVRTSSSRCPGCMRERRSSASSRPVAHACRGACRRARGVRYAC